MLVLGARQQIDELLHKQGEAPQYAAGYRVTDSVAMQTAVQAAGASRQAVEAQLSKVCCVCCSQPYDLLTLPCLQHPLVLWHATVLPRSQNET